MPQIQSSNKVLYQLPFEYRNKCCKVFIGISGLFSSSLQNFFWYLERYNVRTLEIVEYFNNSDFLIWVNYQPIASWLKQKLGHTSDKIFDFLLSCYNIKGISLLTVVCRNLWKSANLISMKHPENGVGMAIHISFRFFRSSRKL